jgi:hypothetical protein
MAITHSLPVAVIERDDDHRLPPVGVIAAAFLMGG